MAGTWMESGTSASQGTEWWTVVSGTVASATDQTHSGPRSLKCTSGVAGAVAPVATPAGVVADSGGRWTKYIRFEALPTTTKLHFGGVSDAAATSNVFLLGLTTTGVLTLYNGPAGAGAAIKSGSTLSVNTWYRISVAFVITSTTNWTIKVWVNGTLDFTATNADATLAATGSDSIRVGWRTASEGNSKSVWIQHFYCDKSNALTDLGDVRVTYVAPTTATTNNWDTTTGTGAVNERPFSATNAKRHNASSSARQAYTIGGPATADIPCNMGTLIARQAFVYAKRVGAVGTGTSKIIHNGTDTAITLTTSDALFTNIVDDVSWPSNSEVVGMVSTANGDDTVMEECGVLVAFIPTQTPTNKRLALLGAAAA